MLNLEELKLKYKPSSLTTFITLIYKDPEGCLLNYLEGAKLVYDWLTNSGAVPLTTAYSGTMYKPHRLSGNYFQQQLAFLIADKQGGDPNYYQQVIRSLTMTMHMESSL